MSGSGSHPLSGSGSDYASEDNFEADSANGEDNFFEADSSSGAVSADFEQYRHTRSSSFNAPTRKSVTTKQNADDIQELEKTLRVSAGVHIFFLLSRL